MTDPIKITSLQLENVKRVRAVALQPDENGLTILGGRNGQGKTSVLDAIAWALGGDRYRPSTPHRDGSVLPPEIRLTLSNGLVVERKGKNSALTVTDPAGKRYGQKLLDAFVGTFAIDLPKFLQASDRDKADMLLKIIGVGPQLKDIEHQINQVYSQRHAIGQIAEQKSAAAKDMPFTDGVPEAPVSASALIQQQQDILLHNAENARKRARKEELEARRLDLIRQIDTLIAQQRQLEDDLLIANQDALDLHDQSTAELEENIRRVDDINAAVRQNQLKRQAEAEAKTYFDQYNTYTVQLEELRQRRRDLLVNAPLPLPGLTVEDGKLLLNGHPWDCMSGAEQLIVGTAIARALQPQCGFVLLDKLEQMDVDTLGRFSEWLQQEGLQAIATRVSTGSECTIIIEDGEGLSPASPTVLSDVAVDSRTDKTPDTHMHTKTWKAGEF